MDDLDFFFSSCLHFPVTDTYFYYLVCEVLGTEYRISSKLGKHPHLNYIPSQKSSFYFVFGCFELGANVNLPRKDSQRRVSASYDVSLVSLNWAIPQACPCRGSKQ